MLYDNMDLSRMMVQVQQVEESQKKRGTREARWPKPHDQEGLVWGLYFGRHILILLHLYPCS